MLDSFCEAKQNEWNSKELEPWEEMLNSIYHMDGGFNLTKALDEFEKKYIYSQLLLRMKSVEGESGRTNDVYCHTEKGNLIFFCIMYF